MDLPRPADRLQSGLLVRSEPGPLLGDIQACHQQAKLGCRGRCPACVCMKGSGKENGQSAVESNLSEAPCSSLLTSENVLKYQRTLFPYGNITQQLTKSVCISQAALLNVVENRQVLYGQHHPFCCILVTLLSHGMVTCPVRTNKNSHFYLINKCMKFICVVAGFYPCYSYLPPLLQCLLHSFAITLHRTNVITFHN